MKYLFFSLLLLTISCSPIVTLHPLSDNKNDFIFKRELIGEWKSTSDKSSSFFVDTVSSDYGPVYHILINDDIKLNLGSKNFNNKLWFFARLIKLNTDYYLDMWFDINHLNKDSINEIESNHESIESDPLLYPGHQIVQIQILDPSHMTYALIDSERLVNLIKSKKINLSYTSVKSTSSSNRETFLIYNESKQLLNIFKQANKLGLFFTNKELIHKVSDDGILQLPEREPIIKK